MVKLILFVFLLLFQTSKNQQFISEITSQNIHISLYDLINCQKKHNLIKGSFLLSLYIQEFNYYWTYWEAQSDPKKLYELYPFPAHVRLYISSNDQSIFGQLVAKAFKDQPVKAVWLSCYNIQSCEQLKGFLNDIKNAVEPNTTVGILTEQYEWNNQINKGKGCSQVPQQYPLFYPYRGFSPFSGWKNAEYIFDSYINNPKECQDYGPNNLVYYANPKQ